MQGITLVWGALFIATHTTVRESSPLTFFIIVT